jgi:malonyl CoA-acyl carrier protein transacylase
MSAAVVNFFPGQGSQTPGMGRRSVERDADAAAFFDRASDAVQMDMRQLCFHATLQQLTPTQVQQPALTAASLATWIAHGQVGRASGDRFAGHSIGAIAAAAASGYLDPVDAVRLAAVRGRLMAETPGAGTMLAVVTRRTASEAAQYAHALRLADQYDLDVAAVNGPTQVVLSGAVAKVEAAHKELGPTSKVLLVSHAFHSRFMAPAQPEWSTALDGALFGSGEGYVRSTDGEPANGAESVREDLRLGLRQPVRWMAVLEATTQDRSSIAVWGPARGVARLARPYLQQRQIRMVEEAGSR